MAIEFDGGTDYYRWILNPPTMPLSFALWVNRQSGTAIQYPFALGENVATANGYAIGIDNDGSRTAYTTRAVTGTFRDRLGGATTPLVWQHLGAVHTSGTDAAVYLNGVIGLTTGGSGTSTPVGLNHISIGGWRRSSLVFPFYGAAAEAGIWNVALTTDEMVSMSKGIKPIKIRPQNLVFYAPLTRLPRQLESTYSTAELQTYGTPTVFSGSPRLY